MAFLTEQEKAQIAAAVTRAERRTSGELVTVIARRSDDYAVVPWMWATLLALMLPGLIELFRLPAPLASAYFSQVMLFVAVLLLLQWEPLKLMLVPRALKQARARRMAREQFFTRNLHLTRERTGVLIFVSLAERHVEIIADEGINRSVPEGAWDGVVARFVERVKAGHTAEGFLETIEACGSYLAEHFPPRPDDTNELPDPLVEI
jgi:putative membrane protein